MWPPPPLLKAKRAVIGRVAHRPCIVCKLKTPMRDHAGVGEDGGSGLWTSKAEAKPLLVHHHHLNPCKSLGDPER